MRYTVVLATGLALILGGCGGGGEGTPERDNHPTSTLVVRTVNYPLRYFAERIGGDAIEVLCPVPEGVDPSGWSPGPEAVATLQEADLILLNGAGYAGWIQKVALPENRMVNTTRNVADRYLAQEEAVTHTHGPEGEHAHGTLAFTTWLDPTLATEQARATLEAMVAARPQHEERFRSAWNELNAELESLDRELATAAKAIGDRPVLFSHPVYQYLEHRYDLNGQSLHWEPDEVPTSAMWEELEHTLEEHPARVMFWEAEPLEKTRSRLASLGIRSVVYAPAAGIPGSGDFMSIMRSNAEAFRVEGNETR